MPPLESSDMGNEEWARLFHSLSQEHSPSERGRSTTPETLFSEQSCRTPSPASSAGQHSGAEEAVATSCAAKKSPGSNLLGGGLVLPRPAPAPEPLGKGRKRKTSASSATLEEPQSGPQSKKAYPNRRGQKLSHHSCEKCRKDKKKCVVEDGAACCTYCWEKGMTCVRDNIDKREFQGKLVKVSKGFKIHNEAMGKLEYLVAELEKLHSERSCGILQTVISTIGDVEGTSAQKYVLVDDNLSQSITDRVFDLVTSGSEKDLVPRACEAYRNGPSEKTMQDYLDGLNVRLSSISPEQSRAEVQGLLEVSKEYVRHVLQRAQTALASSSKRELINLVTPSPEPQSPQPTVAQASLDELASGNDFLLQSMWNTKGDLDNIFLVGPSEPELQPQPQAPQGQPMEAISAAAVDGGFLTQLEGSGYDYDQPIAFDDPAYWDTFRALGKSDFWGQPMIPQPDLVVFPTSF